MPVGAGTVLKPMCAGPKDELAFDVLKPPNDVAVGELFWPNGLSEGAKEEKPPGAEQSVDVGVIDPKPKELETTDGDPKAEVAPKLDRGGAICPPLGRADPLNTAKEVEAGDGISNGAGSLSNLDNTLKDKEPSFPPSLCRAGGNASGVVSESLSFSFSCAISVVCFWGCFNLSKWACSLNKRSLMGASAARCEVV